MPVDDLTKPEIPESNSHWRKATSNSEEQLFLEGPQGRGFEFGRAFRIFRELIHGFRSLHFVGPCITVFGSALSGGTSLLRLLRTHPRIGSENCPGWSVRRERVGAERGARLDEASSAGFAVLQVGPSFFKENL